jgi:hypothetical protein
VKEGDTLEGLARSYLANPRQWPLLQARNKVADPKRLQPGSLIFIPVRLQPSESATVQFVQGEVTAQARGGTAAPIATGSKLEEGTELKVGPESFVAVQLADGTVVRVQAQSELQLRQLRRRGRGRAGSVQSVLEMHKGGVESTVPPSTEPLRRMEIRTPLAVTSVRGTQFSVALAESGQTTASVEHGSVAVQSRRDTDSEPGAALKAPTALLAPGQGLAVATDGTVGAPRTLLSAPDTSGMPATLGDAGLLAIDLPMASGATRYVAQVAQDPEFTQVLRHGSFSDGRLRWKALDDGRYYLAVRALDDAGIAGLPAVQPFIVKTRPVAPLYQHPAPGAVVPSGAAELRCTEVPGVRWYRVQVSADAQFTQPLRDEQRLAECRLPLGALPAGSYFWRIASLLALPDGQADQGPFAPPQPFTVADRPTALSLQALQAEDGDPTVRLHWPAQAGQRFRLQRTEATDLDFAKVGEDTVLDAPTWTASNLPAGEYLVRIKVLDASGLESDFSPPRKIRVGTGIRTGAGLPVSTSSGTPVGRP